MIQWRKEAAVFFGLFILLALSMHFKEWIDHPLAHIEALPQSPLGPWHPIYITAIVYLVILVVRLLIAGIGKLFDKR